MCERLVKREELPLIGIVRNSLFLGSARLKRRLYRFLVHRLSALVPIDTLTCAGGNGKSTNSSGSWGEVNRAKIEKYNLYKSIIQGRVEQERI